MPKTSNKESYNDPIENQFHGFSQMFTKGPCGVTYQI